MTSLNLESTDSKPPQAEMGLLDHLAELRIRLLYSFIAVAVLAIMGYLVSDSLFYLLNKPYFDAFPGEKLIGTGPAEAFVLRLKVSIFAGVVFALPIILFQFWLFVAPGLYTHEKKLVLPFVLCTTILCALGIGFGYKVMFPYAFSFFHDQYLEVGLTPTIRMSEHLSMMITGLLGLAAVFQMPVVAYFLGRAGIIDHSTLISGTRYAIVIIFIVAAVLTPPDVITQFIFAGPLLILYGVSILVVKFTAQKPLEESSEAEMPTRP